MLNNTVKIVGCRIVLQIPGEWLPYLFMGYRDCVPVMLIAMLMVDVAINKWLGCGWQLPA